MAYAIGADEAVGAAIARCAREQLGRGREGALVGEGRAGIGWFACVLQAALKRPGLERVAAAHVTRRRFLHAAGRLMARETSRRFPGIVLGSEIGFATETLVTREAYWDSMT